MTSSSFEVLELAGTVERRGRLGFGGLFLFEVGVAFCSRCQSGAQKRLVFFPKLARVCCSGLVGAELLCARLSSVQPL